MCHRRKDDLEGISFKQAYGGMYAEENHTSSMFVSSPRRTHTHTDVYSLIIDDNNDCSYDYFYCNPSLNLTSDG